MENLLDTYAKYPPPSFAPHCTPWQPGSHGSVATISSVLVSTTVIDVPSVCAVTIHLSSGLTGVCIGSPTMPPVPAIMSICLVMVFVSKSITDRVFPRKSAV